MYIVQHTDDVPTLWIDIELLNFITMTALNEL